MNEWYVASACLSIDLFVLVGGGGEAVMRNSDTSEPASGEKGAKGEVNVCVYAVTCNLASRILPLFELRGCGCEGV